MLKRLQDASVYCVAGKFRGKGCCHQALAWLGLAVYIPGASAAKQGSAPGA